MVFCKGKNPTVNLYYGSQPLHQVTSYKYLGILFCSNGSFTLCQEDLFKRASRAYFKMSKYFVDCKSSIRTFLKLFDHIVKPILLYACEIWGTINITSTIVQKDDYLLEHSFKNMYCDKLHLKSLKYILGVHKKSVNDAVLGETGRYPLYINIVTHCTKYFSRLIEADQSTLLFAAFQESCTLSENNKPSWMSSIKFLFNKLKIEQHQHYLGNLFNTVKSRAIEDYRINWSKRLEKSKNENTGKLRTYATFKTHFCFEPYLTIIKDPYIKSLVTKFRISAHKLEIETGRYTNVAVENRICKCCALQHVENEQHFLLKCPLYAMPRTVYLSTVSSIVKHFDDLTLHDQFVYLMSSENDEIISATGNFIHQCNSLRLKHLATC